MATMIGWDAALAFFATSLLLAIAPGPDNLFVLTQSALYGVRSGFAVILGLCTGLIVQTLAVILGLAALFQASEVAFTVLKFVGAGYLLFLAYKAFRAKAETLDEDSGPQLGLGHYYRRGIIMNITNPKVTVFFLAFLPQFVQPARGPIAFQLAALGVLFIVATLIVFGAIAVLSGITSQAFKKSPKIQTVLNKAAAVVFTGLAVKLLLSER